jgi:hypothetical protein
MGNALKEFAKQFSKNVAEKPGWVPLLILVYLVLSAGLPGTITLFGFRLTVPEKFSEILAVAIAFLCYDLGDSLDKAVFKKRQASGFTDRFKPGWVECARTKARSALQLRSGIYAASMALCKAAEKKGSKIAIVHLFNESAKFIRSLVLPLAVMAIFCLCQALYLRALGLFVAALVCIPLFLFLKLWHIGRLYLSAANVKEQNPAECKVEPLGSFNLLFWEGVLIGSGERLS